jgi:hypothetical protein
LDHDSHEKRESFFYVSCSFVRFVIQITHHTSPRNAFSNLAPVMASISCCGDDVGDFRRAAQAPNW